MAEATLESVRDMVMDSLNLRDDRDPEEIGWDRPLFGDEDLELDSLDALQLAVAMEEQFGVTVDETQGRAVLQSVRTITDYVNAQASAGS